ncbi:hypothetical protein ACFY0G_44225 [Streptomyces sp. NPDC001552]|uniref:hypothetical protein n=1 Tax=Streptomyces sp. NPDC001552 TaxID=3364587 RepID=UPI0036789C2E
MASPSLPAAPAWVAGHYATRYSCPPLGRIGPAAPGRVRERAEQARAELASMLGTVPSEEAEAKARGLLERLGARQDAAAA